jgi:TetR/AcrR family transcriptional repressor of nem operon
MRYDSEHKERTRRKVLTEAAAAIREMGPDRIGVAGLMAKAGLTHGGFYAHFTSKDDLIAQAIGRMFEDSHGNFVRWTQDRPPAEGLARFIENYVSARHRDARGRGCPIPSLSGDLARMPPEARERFTEGVGTLTSAIAGLLERMGRPDAQVLAASVMAEMTGALALSRAVDDPARSDRILDASRTALKARLGL